MKCSIKNAVRIRTVLAVLCALAYVPLNAESRTSDLFRRINFSMSSSASLPFENMAQTSLGINAGIRALFRDADVRIYEAIPEASFKKAGSFAGFFKNAALPQYGALLSLQQFVTFPLTVKAGTLSASGSFSRLSSPELATTVSPFTKSVSTKTGITTLLPSSGSGKKQLAASLDMRFPKNWKIFNGSGGAFYCRADGTVAASTDFLIKFPRMITAGFSLTGGRFFLENKSSLWFSEMPFFKNSWFGAFAVQSFVSSPHFTSMNTVNAYTQPDAPARFTFRSENKLTLGKFTVLFAGFAADGTGIFTTDSSTLHTLAQVRVAPQYTWRFATPRLPSFTLGAVSLTQRKYAATTNSAYETEKFSLGAQYVDKQLSASLSFAADGFEFSRSEGASAKNSTYTVSTQFSTTHGKLHPSVRASCAFSSKSSSQSVKVSLAISEKNLMTTTSAGFSLKQKKGAYDSGSAALSFSATYTAKFIKYAFKVSATGKY
ncbi:MAG: hypothetical protein IJR50_00130 [Treponema sp.]|nr:hypothetical protein [Treponema sp.]